MMDIFILSLKIWIEVEHTMQNVLQPRHKEQSTDQKLNSPHTRILRLQRLQQM